MLSVCIPVFNCDVSQLVDKINYQADNQKIEFEIILIDDCSNFEFKVKNKSLTQINSVKYIQLENNIGRSKIRNLFLKYVSFNNLLFLDCDSQVLTENFVEIYINEIKKGEKIICGGRIYNTEKPQLNNFLRWNYGIHRECIPAEIRKKNPYQSFMTNNFIVHKTILEQIKFNEKLSDYGHEDTLFGYQLKQNKLKVSHIKNPVNHLFTETNEEFLDKTKQGIRNLIFIQKGIGNYDFISEVKILKFYSKIKKYYLKIPFQVLLYLTKPLVYFPLKKYGRGLLLFDIYKISILINEKFKY